MMESALYILSGIACYGGAQQLYLGARQMPHYPHVLHGVMFFLLAGFSLAGALSYQPQAFATLLPAGKLTVSLGLVLWGMLAWFVAAYTQVKPRIVIALLTVAWSLHLIGNIGSPLSLLYSDITPLQQTLPSGQSQVAWHTRISTWWSVVQFTMLATLTFTLYASVRLFRQGDQRSALALASGLTVLLVVSVADFLVTVQLIQSAYLAPFGFLVLLLAASLYPRLQNAPKHTPAGEAADVYKLALDLHQPVQATRIRYVPADQQQPVLKAQPPQAEMPHRDTSPAGFTDKQEAETVPVPAAVRPAAQEREDDYPDTATPVEREGERLQEQETPKPVPEIDKPTLSRVSDNLIDIAVYATMAMNRFKRGDADPAALEVLCNRVRTEAIKTHRMANQLSRPDTDTDTDTDKDQSAPDT